MVAPLVRRRRVPFLAGDAAPLLAGLALSSGAGTALLRLLTAARFAVLRRAIAALAPLRVGLGLAIARRLALFFRRLRLAAGLLAAGLISRLRALLLIRRRCAVRGLAFLSARIFLRPGGVLLVDRRLTGLRVNRLFAGARVLAFRLRRITAGLRAVAGVCGIRFARDAGLAVVRFRAGTLLDAGLRGLAGLQRFARLGTVVRLRSFTRLRTVARLLTCGRFARFVLAGVVVAGLRLVARWRLRGPVAGRLFGIAAGVILAGTTFAVRLRAVAGWLARVAARLGVLFAGLLRRLIARAAGSWLVSRRSVAL